MLDHVDDDDILADPGQKGESINTEQSNLATQSGSFKSLAFNLSTCPKPTPSLNQTSIDCMRLCFPAISQSQPLTALLPQYIATLGKKIDLAEQAKEWKNTLARSQPNSYRYLL